MAQRPLAERISEQEKKRLKVDATLVRMYATEAIVFASDGNAVEAEARLRTIAEDLKKYLPEA